MTSIRLLPLQGAILSVIYPGRCPGLVSRWPFRPSLHKIHPHSTEKCKRHRPEGEFTSETTARLFSSSIIALRVCQNGNTLKMKMQRKKWGYLAASDHPSRAAWRACETPCSLSEKSRDSPLTVTLMLLPPSLKRKSSWVTPFWVMDQLSLFLS